MLFVHFACVYLRNGADSIILVGSSSFYIYKFVTTNMFNCSDTIAYKDKVCFVTILKVLKIKRQ